MSPMPGVLEEPRARVAERPVKAKPTLKEGRKQKKNSICLSADQVALGLPVLGLDVAKASVRAELGTKERKVRFGFANNAKGFAQLARVLEQQGAPKIWAGLEATGPYSEALALWLHAQGHRVSLLNPGRVKQYAASAGRRWTPLLSPILFAP